MRLQGEMGMIIKTKKGVHRERLFEFSLVLFTWIWLISYNRIVMSPQRWLCLGVANIPVLFYLFQWIQISKTIVMSSEGCVVKLWKINKKYSWDEFKIKRIERFTRYRDGWTEGVVFCKHFIFKTKMKHPENHAWIAPYFSYIFVCFVEENNNEKKTTREQSYPVNKDEFMEKMRLWNVELEDCRK